MANYEQNYDPQSYVTTPYQLPIQAMTQALQTRNDYWDSAASNLRNVYQNYLGLQLSRSDNQQTLNGLMDNVTDNLKQASKTDLSIGDNYGKAMSIFNPIVQNNDIMGDNAITKHYQQELSTAQLYRQKDNGKEYSDTNVKDLTNHLEDFVKDPNASNWRQYYANRSYYTPYTDVSAETRQIAKDFKPNVNSLTSPVYIDPTTGKITPQGGSPSGYLLSQTDKSIIASQYRAFVDAHLSDKAKNQLAIDGRVKYHDNIGALAQDYTSYNQDQINYHSSEMDKIKGEIAGNNSTQAQKDAATQQLNNHQAAIDELKTQNTKMAAGDYSNITPYKDQIAGALYSNKYVDFLSKASAQRNLDVKYSQDQVWKTMYDESNENSRFNTALLSKQQIANERNETLLKIHYGLYSGGLGGIPTYAPSDNTNNESFGADQLSKMQTASADSFTAATDQLNKVIKDRTGIDMTDKSIPQAQRDATYAKFMGNSQNSSDVNDFKTAAQKKSLDDMVYKSINDWTDNQIKTTNPDVFNYRQNIISGINKGENLTLNSKDGKSNPINLNLSAQDIKDIISGTSKYRLGSYQEGSSNYAGPGMGSYTTTNVTTLNVNGKEYRLPYSNLSQSLDKINEGATDYINKRNDLLNQQINRIQGVEKVFQDDKNPYEGGAKDVIRGIIGSAKSDIKPEDILITDRDKDGGLYFKVQGDQKIDQNDVQKNVEANRGRYVDAQKKFYLPGDQFGLLTKQPQFSDPRMSSLQTLIDFRSSANKNDIFNTPPITFGNKDFTLKVDVRNGQPSYKIFDQNTGAFFGQNSQGMPYQTLQDALSRAQFLGNISNDQYINLVRTIGGVPDYQQK